MASGPITSWQIDGETMETVTDYFLGLQNPCRWWLQPWNLKTFTPWKKGCDQPRQPIKNISLPTKIHLVKAMVFQVVIYGCESWTIKKASHQKIDAFELWCWNRLLRVPWTARRPINPKGNQPWVSIGRTDAEAETSTLATWCEELTHWKRSWCWERLKIGGKGDDRGIDGWMASLTDGHKFEKAPRDGDGQGSLVYCSPWLHK